MVNATPLRRAVMVFALVLAGCGTVEVPADRVGEVIGDAFAEADVAPDAIVVEPARGGDLYAASVRVDGAEVAVLFDPGPGTIVNISLGESRALTQEQIVEIATHRSNPSDDAARRRRAATVFATIAALCIVGYLLARRAMQREQGPVAGV